MKKARDTQGSRFIGFALLALLAATPMVLVVGTPEASAVCAAPQISLSSDSAPPGGAFKVSGQFFATTCHDVVLCSAEPSPTPSDIPSGTASPTPLATPTVSPSYHCQSPPPDEPMTRIAVKFVQGSHSWTLAIVDGFSFSETIRVPADASPGAAKVVAADAEASFTVLGPQLPTTGGNRLVALPILLAVLIFSGGLLALRRARSQLK